MRFFFLQEKWKNLLSDFDGKPYYSEKEIPLNLSENESVAETTFKSQKWLYSFLCQLKDQI